jgi:hypothetical protein
LKLLEAGDHHAATGLVDDAITPAPEKGIVGQAGKPAIIVALGVAYSLS